MNISFAPLAPEAKAYLSTEGIDFTRVDMSDWLCATAIDERQEIVGVLACQPKGGGWEWSFHAIVTDPRCLSRRLLRTIFVTLFTTGVRITALVSPTNERAIRQMHRLGFVYEGFKRRGIDGVRDGLMFGMLAEDCRYLPGHDPERATPALPYSEIGGRLHG